MTKRSQEDIEAIDIEQILGISNIPMLPPAPEAFGLLAPPTIAEEEEPSSAASENIPVSDSDSTPPRGKKQGKKSHRAHPVLHAISTIICTIALIFGLALMAYPAVSDQFRLDDIYDKMEPVEYVVYDGRSVPVIEYYEAERAPDGPVAGLWLDSTVVARANYSYIVGHNPGIFSFVLDIEVGDIVEIVDVEEGPWDFGMWRYEAGDIEKTYVVNEIVDVDRGTYVNEIEERFSEEEDVLVLQACVDEGEKLYRVVICLPS